MGACEFVLGSYLQRADHLWAEGQVRDLILLLCTIVHDQYIKLSKLQVLSKYQWLVREWIFALFETSAMGRTLALPLSLGRSGEPPRTAVRI